MGVDEDKAGAAVGCDTIGWEGVVGDEVEYFAGARVGKAIARRAHALGSGERGWCGVKSRGVFQLDGREVRLELGGAYIHHPSVQIRAMQNQVFHRRPRQINKSKTIDGNSNAQYSSHPAQSFLHSGDYFHE